MKTEDPSVSRMWREYLASAGDNPSLTKRTYTSWHFCDNKKDADELAELVLAGEKRATAGLYSEYMRENEPIPKSGDLSIITDYDGEAKCVIQTVNVTLLPFDEVPPSFAAREGEGDKSLRWWREAHRRYFTRELEAAGLRFSDDMLVVCEEFDMVYPVPI